MKIETPGYAYDLLYEALLRDGFASLYRDRKDWRRSEEASRDLEPIANAVLDILALNLDFIESESSGRPFQYMPQSHVSSGEYIALYNNPDLSDANGGQHPADVEGGLDAVVIYVSAEAPQYNEIALIYRAAERPPSSQGHIVIRVNRGGDISVVLWTRRFPWTSLAMSSMRASATRLGTSSEENAIDLIAGVPEFLATPMIQGAEEDIAKLATHLNTVAAELRSRAQAGGTVTSG